MSPIRAETRRPHLKLENDDNRTASRLSFGVHGEKNSNLNPFYFETLNPLDDARPGCGLLVLIIRYKKQDGKCNPAWLEGLMMIMLADDPGRHLMAEAHFPAPHQSEASISSGAWARILLISRHADDLNLNSNNIHNSVTRGAAPRLERRRVAPHAWKIFYGTQLVNG